MIINIKALDHLEAFIKQFIKKLFNKLQIYYFLYNFKINIYISVIYNLYVAIKLEKLTNNDYKKCLLREESLIL